MWNTKVHTVGTTNEKKKATDEPNQSFLGTRVKYSRAGKLVSVLKFRVIEVIRRENTAPCGYHIKSYATLLNHNETEFQTSDLKLSFQMN